VTKIGRLHNKIFLANGNNIFKVIDINRIETLSYPAKALGFKKFNNRTFVKLLNDIIASR